MLPFGNATGIISIINATSFLKITWEETKCLIVEKSYTQKMETRRSVKIFSLVLVRCVTPSKILPSCQPSDFLFWPKVQSSGLQATGELHEDVIFVLPPLHLYLLPHVWYQYK